MGWAGRVFPEERSFFDWLSLRVLRRRGLILNYPYQWLTYLNIFRCYVIENHAFVGIKVQHEF